MDSCSDSALLERTRGLGEEVSRIRSRSSRTWDNTRKRTRFGLQKQETAYQSIQLDPTRQRPQSEGPFRLHVSIMQEDRLGS